MLTWRLWRALNQRGASVLGARMFRRRATQERAPRWYERFAQALITIFAPVFTVVLGFPLLITIYYLSLISAPLIVPIATTLYGLAQVVGAGDRLMQERERGTYDLLTLIPGGTFGVNWSVAAGWIRHHGAFRWVLFALVGIGAFAAFLGLGTQLIFQQGAETLVVAVAQAVAISTIFAVDTLSVVVIGSLIVVLTPMYSTTRFNATVLSVSAFLGIQITSYIATLALASVIGPALNQSFGGREIVVGVVSPLLVALTFAAFREGAIVILWRAADLTFGAGNLD